MEDERGAQATPEPQGPPSPARGPRLRPTSPWANSWHHPGGSSPGTSWSYSSQSSQEGRQGWGEGTEKSGGKGEPVWGVCGCVQKGGRGAVSTGPGPFQSSELLRK